MTANESNLAKARTLVTWLFCIVLFLRLGPAGLEKFTDSASWIARVQNWSYPGWFSWVIGLLEVGGAVLVLVPALASLGAGILLVVMLGAAATLFVHGVTFPVLPLGNALLAALVIALRWERRWFKKDA